jgi:2-methylcitrate dehydratase PrpD
MTTGQAHELIHFLQGLSLDRVPTDLIARTKVCILDALGCGIFGSEQEWSKIVADEMFAETDSGSSTVIGRTKLLPAPQAALCNGTAIHGFELDDLIAESIVHPAAAVIPAALAAAEAVDASTGRLLLGIIAGYETMHRVGLALGVEPARRGFHTTGVVGPIAAAVAAGIVMDLPLEKLLSAIGLAASVSSGIKNFATGHGGGMVKRLQLGRSAEAGVRMCQLAERGFAGPPNAVDGTFGLLEVFGGAGAQPTRLTRDLGSKWAVRDVWFKVYPMCGWLHTTVQSILQLRGPEPLLVGDVKAVQVGVSKYAARNNREPSPIDPMGAQYSLPYCVATAILGDPRDPAAFTPQAVRNPMTNELARRVEVLVDPEVEAVYPAKFGATVVLTLADGETRTGCVMDCHGTPADPCDEQELRNKFSLLAGKTLPVAQTLAIAECLEDLDEDSPVKRLTQNLISAFDAKRQDPLEVR